MSKVREVVSSALEIRQKSGIKVRQPLNELRITNNELRGKDELIELIKDEVNVKKVTFISDGEFILDTELTEDLKEEGIARDIIRVIQDARKTEGLSLDQKIKIIISTNKKSTVDKYLEMIKSVTGATEISYSKDKQKYSNFSIVK